MGRNTVKWREQQVLREGRSAVKIYTKAGDLGETSLWGKAGLKRTLKDSPRVEAYGAVDEANALIGLARAEGLSDADLDQQLAWVQHRLFALGSDLANIAEQRSDRLAPRDVEQLEQWIDGWEADLPSLRAFILPGGSRAAAALHLGRTVVRRAERRTVSFFREESSYSVHVKFLNRLSDYLFVAARRANQNAGIQDVRADF